MRILIVQSTGYGHIKEMVLEKFPRMKKIFSYTDSFDHALEILKKMPPKEPDSFIITSEMFHDELAQDKASTRQIISEESKDGNTLAKLAKAINPLAKVYAFSEFKPSGNFIDGCLLKGNGSFDEKTQRIEGLLQAIINGTVENFLKKFGE